MTSTRYSHRPMGSAPPSPKTWTEITTRCPFPIFPTFTSLGIAIHFPFPFPYFLYFLYTFVPLGWVRPALSQLTFSKDEGQIFRSQTDPSSTVARDRTRWRERCCNFEHQNWKLSRMFLFWTYVFERTSFPSQCFWIRSAGFHTFWIWDNTNGDGPRNPILQHVA